jgi:hypothetical protein
VRVTLGASDATFALTAVSVGTPTKFTAATLTVSLAAGSAGARSTFSASAFPIVVITTTDGGGDVLTLYGQTSTTLTLASTTAAGRTTVGASTLTVTDTATTAGIVRYLHPLFGDPSAGDLLQPGARGRQTTADMGHQTTAEGGSVVGSNQSGTFGPAATEPVRGGTGTLT